MRQQSRTPHLFHPEHTPSGCPPNLIATFIIVIVGPLVFKALWGFLQVTFVETALPNRQWGGRGSLSKQKMVITGKKSLIEVDENRHHIYVYINIYQLFTFWVPWKFLPRNSITNSRKLPRFFRHFVNFAPCLSYDPWGNWVLRSIVLIRQRSVSH